jgi:WD40 repeat protein
LPSPRPGNSFPAAATGVRIWDLGSRACLQPNKAASVVYALAVSPDGKELAFAGRYTGGLASSVNTTQFWDLQSGARRDDIVWQTGRFAYSVWTLSYSVRRRVPGCRLPFDGRRQHPERRRWTLVATTRAQHAK